MLTEGGGEECLLWQEETESLEHTLASYFLPSLTYSRNTVEIGT
jgi:hypothetical protein